jgi:hypothetical protein
MNKTPEQMARDNIDDQPDTLQEWLKNEKTLRARLLDLPALPGQGLRKCQVKAINDLEKSFKENRPRALIQMATGSGKTFTAITAIYRLLKFCKAKRVLFLVDKWGQPIMTARRHPKTMKTLPPRHQDTKDFFINKPLGVPLCLRAFVAIFMVGEKSFTGIERSCQWPVKEGIEEAERNGFFKRKPSTSGFITLLIEKFWLEYSCA